MAVITMATRTADYLLNEDIYLSRDKATVALGAGVVAAGTVLGVIVAGSATAAAQAGNTGNATTTAVSIGADAEAGVYIVEFTSATAFYVRDPSGDAVGTGNTGTAFQGPINFTVTVGGTPMVAGDGFNVTVLISGKTYAPVSFSATDGSQEAAAILFEGGTGTISRTITARHSAVTGAHLTYPSGATAGQKLNVDAQLAARNIIVR